MSVFFFVFYCGLFSFIFFHYHFLYLLISLEMMMLSMYFMFFFFCSLSVGGFSSLLMVYLIMMVCGSAFSIVLLVNFVRVSGNDMFSYI
uniref:NADH dehydrogenase subunit 4L n=1 Tax=Unionicola foili TaxID=350889 RepID=B3W615_9ACAR|nr:NADH dehydrogenase subunit 4L [Unionicola foili]ACF19642.1 NADH dehydrogenase subunit 4L [Unionicola foili]